MPCRIKTIRKSRSI